MASTMGVAMVPGQQEVGGPFVDGLEHLVVRTETQPRTAQTPQTLLLALAEHLLNKRDLVMLLCFDRSVQGHPVKQRTHDLLNRIQDLLAGPAPDQDRAIRAAAAIGAVILPVLLAFEEGASRDSAATTITHAALAALTPPTHHDASQSTTLPTHPAHDI
jgi:hypothetical protein